MQYHPGLLRQRGHGWIYHKGLLRQKGGAVGSIISGLVGALPLDNISGNPLTGLLKLSRILTHMKPQKGGNF